MDSPLVTLSLCLQYGVQERGLTDIHIRSTLNGYQRTIDLISDTIDLLSADL